MFIYTYKCIYNFTLKKTTEYMVLDIDGESELCLDILIELMLFPYKCFK